MKVVAPSTQRLEGIADQSFGEAQGPARGHRSIRDHIELAVETGAGGDKVVEILPSSGVVAGEICSWWYRFARTATPDAAGERPAVSPAQEAERRQRRGSRLRYWDRLYRGSGRLHKPAPHRSFRLRSR